MFRIQRGFTLVEILVVIAIIGLIVPILYANYNTGRAEARDAERQTTLRTLQSAIELYKNKYGRYPDRCPSLHGSWSGQPGTVYACSSGANEYILGLAPEFIPKLPLDVKLNGTDSGYVYTVNADGSVYKLLARRTVESEVVTLSHDLRSCAVTSSGADTGPICNYLWGGGASFNTVYFNNSGSPIQHCRPSNAIFQTSYGVWGGYADPGVPPTNGQYTQRSEMLTENTICRIQ